MWSGVRKKKVIVALVLLSSLVSATASYGYTGGISDATIGYGGCAVTGCHFDSDALSNATIEMWASNVSVIVDQTVTVYVNVTSWTLSSSRIIGVFLLRALTASDDDLPATDGWRILDDPNGNTNNFVQKVAGSVGETVAFRWQLRAPFSAGTFNLYARVHHGGGRASWVDSSPGLTFVVSPDLSIQPDLVLVDVFHHGETVVGSEIVFYGTVSNDYSEELHDVSVRFLVDGEIVSELQNQSYAANKVRNATVHWVANESGTHVLKIIVDPLDSVGESNETNNDLSIEFEISDVEVEDSIRTELIIVSAAFGVFFIIILIWLIRGREHEEI
jgi:hypothetical protein